MVERPWIRRITIGSNRKGGNIHARIPSQLVAKALPEEPGAKPLVKNSRSGWTRKSLEDELIEEALGAFRSRAELIAKSLGAASWSLVGLSIDGDGHAPEMYARRARAQMAITVKSAPPALEAGSSEIRIRVDGTIALDP